MASRVKGAGPIAAKVRAEMKRHAGGKVVNLKDVAAGRAAAEELQRTVATSQELAGMHPAHAAYTYAQNQASVMSEQLTALDAMAPFVDLVSEAEDLYMPSGPPMSPLTVSYFTCWALFDARFGTADETLGTTVLEVGAEFGVHPELLRVIGLMQHSRMGVYHHEGTEGGITVLRDLATDTVSRCIVPAGYIGEKGQLWYARVLPPPLQGRSEHVVFTTPYVIVQARLQDWTAYFHRVSAQTSQQARIDERERHLKYGPSRNYWNEFVFEGYVNHSEQAIFLAGLPDAPASRPHNDAYIHRSR